MKHFKPIGITAIVIILMLSACSKDEIAKEDFPVLGTCKPVAFTGNLSQSSTDNKITYLTNGGGKIVIDKYLITISHTDYPEFHIAFWSIIQEDLNGKHMKSFLGDRRSLIFPDGAKITIVNGKLNDSRISISIHEGNSYCHLNNSCNTLEYSTLNSPYAQQLDDAEADGETATFEITKTGLNYHNIYIEDTPGNKVEERVSLGRIYKDQPKMTYDDYDDPRLANT